MHKKLAFIGSVGSGKTTIINQLSSIETVNTDVESSVDIGKEFTTVGIDYGHINLGEDMSIGLYGIPGQRRFSFVWDFVSDGLWAIVILIKNGDKDSLSEMAHLMEYFGVNKETTCVVGITHAEGDEAGPFTQKVRHLTNEFEMNSPIYHVDARNNDSAMLIMNTVIAIKEATE